MSARTVDDVLREFDALCLHFDKCDCGSLAMARHILALETRLATLDAERCDQVDAAGEWFTAYQTLQAALWEAVGTDALPDAGEHPNEMNLACVTLLASRNAERAVVDAAKELAKTMSFSWSCWPLGTEGTNTTHVDDTKATALWHAVRALSPTTPEASDGE